MLIYLQMIETVEDRQKFTDLYETYRGLMFYVANQILHNAEDAEDAVHQAFLSIMENLDKISEVHSPKSRAYVIVIAENKAIDMIRARKHFADAGFDESVYGIEIPVPGDGGLADAMAKLPARYRGILLLRYDMGYSTKEIGKMLGMTEDTTRKVIWRAKEALRRQLEAGERV